MVRSRLLPIVLAIAFTAMLCVSVQGQMATDEMPSAEMQGRIVPAPVPPGPFSADAPTGKADLSIQFRSATQMTERDRNLAADAESSIAEHAGFTGFELEQGKWSYRQIMCPALPGHLFLQYRRNNGRGDLTVFTASIPRGGEGRVRIIPIVRRGYSLFSPAPINSLTISAFNHIRAEEPSGQSANWLGTGLCYAALAGAHPHLVAPDAEPSVDKPVPAMTGIMEVRENGGEVIRFADASATPEPMEWTMTFTAKGKLIKATHTRSPLIKVRPVPRNSANIREFSAPQDTKN